MEIFVIETKIELILLQVALSDSQMPIHLETVTCFKDAFICLEQGNFSPDVLLIGSDVILREGFEKLLKLRTDEKLRLIPCIVLTEFTGEEKHLFQENHYNTHFLAKPFGLDEMPKHLNKIIEIGRLTLSKEE